MYIDRYCATESLSSLVRQHIPGATLLQQDDQQLVYSLPFKDMDKFAGTTFIILVVEQRFYVGNRCLIFFFINFSV